MRWSHSGAEGTLGGMKIYFSPLACSVATRIALYEAGATATFVEVDPKTKTTSEGTDYRTVHPIGIVPCLDTEEGLVLVENVAVLQFIAARYPEAGLAPTDPIGRAKLYQWLSFVGAELHKGLFIPLLDKTSTDAVKAFALEKAPPRLRFIDAALAGRETLLERFSIADAYLVTILNWTAVLPQVGLERYPALTAFLSRTRQRPSVARAFGEELPLYQQELERERKARAGELRA